MKDGKLHALNAMMGLAIGDAISWTAMFHRGFLLPAWTRRIRREMDSTSETENVTLLSMPFSLNQSAQHFDISPTDVTEWAAFSAGILLSNGINNFKQSVFKEWINLAESNEPIRGGVSTQAALNNLRKGIQPPRSGKENPHYFDDGAMSRAVPIGIVCNGQPYEAARVAEIDASVTNSEDGVWAAQAMAVAISLVCSGKNIIETIETAHQILPESSWISRTVDEALKLVEKNKSIFSIFPILNNNIVNREYSYGNVASETLALTFAIAQIHGNNFETALTTALGFAKSGETLPAMVGALVGAMHSQVIASESWLNAIRSLKGICIPSLAGKNYLRLAETISNISRRKIVK